MTVEELLALGAVFVGGQIDLDNKHIGTNTADGPVLFSGVVFSAAPKAPDEPVVRRGRRSAMVLPELPLDQE